MKIRPDFVTNSSSNSQALIWIDNIILLEILQRYKEMGTFGDIEPYFGIGTYETAYPEWFDSSMVKIKTPAFFYFEDCGQNGWSQVFNDPKEISEVLQAIIDIIECDSQLYGHQDLHDQELYKQFKLELSQRENEIRNAYTRVYWSHKDDEPEGTDECSWEFYYDQENGEQYKVGLIEDCQNDDDQFG